MNNEQINKFDSVVRESTAHFELPFNDAAWNIMDKKLDKEFGNNSKKRFLFWWLPTITIAVIGGIFIYQHNTTKQTLHSLADIKGEVNVDKSKPTEQQGISNNTTIKNKDKKNITNLKSNNNNNNTKNSINNKIINTITNTQSAKGIVDISKQTNAKSEFITSNKILINKEKNSTKSQNLNKNSGVVKIENNVNDNKINESKNDFDNINATQNLPTKSIKNSNSIAAISSLRTLESIENNNDISSKRFIYNYSAAQMHNRFLPKYKLAELAASKIPKPDMSFYYPKQPIKLLTVYPEIPVPNRWYVGGSIAGNISYSSNPRIADLKVGYNFYVGINVNNQVSFQTGLSYGNKQFDLRKDQFIYSGNNILWEKYIRAAYVNTDVLEIPITVRYQFSEKPNTGLFCTAGFSSLFFNKENYTLNLDWGTLIPDYKDWNFTNGQTIFTMFNASVGYQFPVNKYYTITAEQTIQLPTKNIGGAAMRMSTTGFQIGVRYNLIGKKK